MAVSRRSYKGAPVSNTIGGGGLAAGATSITLGVAVSGWPTGSYPFFVVVDPGTSKEEKICVKYATTTTLTVVDPAATSTWAASVNGRGADDTTDRAHDAGATIYPVFTAYEADDANELASAYTANGDLVVHGSTTFKKIGVGTNAHVLQADSTVTDGGVKWGQVATAGIADDAVTMAKLAAAVEAFLVPVGTISAYAGASAPTGWLLCDGTSTTGYTALAALVGSTTPDLRGKFLLGKTAAGTGSTLLGSGGSATIAETNLPSHTHSIDHDHGSVTSGAMSANATLAHSGHTHTVAVSTGTPIDFDGTSPGYVADVISSPNGSASTVTTSSTTVASHDVSHTHAVDLPNYTGTSGNGSGSGTAYWQPFVAVSYIIKHD